MASNNEESDVASGEQKFKEYLLELGLLTEITPPLQPDAIPENRQPAPVVGNPVSERVIKERR